MHCADARGLMAAQLDENGPVRDLPEALGEHVADCADCAELWPALARVEQLLLSEALPEAPANLSSRVVAEIEADGRRRKPWSSSLLHVLALLSGVGFSAATAALATGQGGLLSAGSLYGEQMLRVAGQSISLMGGLGLILAASEHAWLIYAGLSAVLAALWFAALILPRSARAGVAARDR